MSKSKNKEDHSNKRIKRKYKQPLLKTETLKAAYATAMGGGGGATCNGGTNGGRKATAGAGCSTLLT